MSKGTDLKKNRHTKVKNLHSNCFGDVVFEVQAKFFSIQLWLVYVGKKKSQDKERQIFMISFSLICHRPMIGLIAWREKAILSK